MVNQGESAQLACFVRKGDMPVTITWSLKGDDISSDPLLTTTAIGQRTSLLIISSVAYRHSGQYTCTARNPAGHTTHSAELRVNGMKCLYKEFCYRKTQDQMILIFLCSVYIFTLQLTCLLQSKQTKSRYLSYFLFCFFRTTKNSALFFWSKHNQ